MTTDPAEHLFWIASRAAGITALLLATASVALGLLMGARMVRGRRAADARSLHEVLALGTVGALLVHGFALLGDGWLQASFWDVVIPFAMGHQRFWTGLGVLAGWSFVLLGLSFYARHRIGMARWRLLHRFTALAWVLGVAHSLGEGTDAGQVWFLAMTAVVAVPAALLLVGRLTAAPRPA